MRLTAASPEIARQMPIDVFLNGERARNVGAVDQDAGYIDVLALDRNGNAITLPGDEFAELRLFGEVTIAPRLT